MENQGDGAAGAGSVTVSHGRADVKAAAGSSVSFGRRDDCDLVLPSDDFISRHAGDIEIHSDRVIVWNRSQTKPILVRPFAGQDVVIEPGDGHAPSPEDFDVFELMLSGRGGAVVTVHVDARGLGRSATPGSGAPSGRDRTVTHRAEIAWKPHQHRVLVALCEPLFTRRGTDATPATYQQVADRLGLQPAYVRNVVRGIRDALTALGLPGLSVDEDAVPQVDFRIPLAQWAKRHRWVTADDVDRLDDPGPGEPDRRSGGTAP